MLLVVVSMAIIILDLQIADISKNPGKTTDVSHMCHNTQRGHIGLTRTTNEQLTLRKYYFFVWKQYPKPVLHDHYNQILWTREESQANMLHEK